MWKTLLAKDLYTFALIVMSFNVTFFFNTCSSIKDINFVSASVGSGDEIREILNDLLLSKIEHHNPHDSKLPLLYNQCYHNYFRMLESWRRLAASFLKTVAHLIGVSKSLPILVMTLTKNTVHTKDPRTCHW